MSEPFYSELHHIDSPLMYGGSSGAAHGDSHEVYGGQEFAPGGGGGNAGVLHSGTGVHPSGESDGPGYGDWAAPHQHMAPEGTTGVDTQRSFVQPGEEGYGAEDNFTGKKFSTQEGADAYGKGLKSRVTGGGLSSSSRHYTDESGTIRDYSPDEVAAYQKSAKSLKSGNVGTFKTAVRTTETPYAEDAQGNREPAAGSMMTGIAMGNASPRSMESVSTGTSDPGSRLATQGNATGKSVGSGIAVRNGAPAVKPPEDENYAPSPKDDNR